MKIFDNALSTHKCTTSGGLYEMMKQTRLQYHYAVKVAKREANRLESEALGAAADAGDQQIFKELKKHLADKRSCGQPFPDSLEGKVTEEDIVDKYRECYSALYNSAPSDMQTVKQHIEDLIRCNIHPSLAEVNRITPAIVKEASTMMKCGKNDVSGEYTSDVFKFAPDLLFEHLAEVFKSCAVHGSIPLEWLSCAFIPLYKGGLKDPRKFDSYRAIASASQLLKLMEYTILILWGDLMQSDSLQCGFKKKSSCSMASWLVLEVCMYFNQRGTMVHGACLDLSKAFDKIQFSQLFNKLLEQGIPAVVVRVLSYGAASLGENWRKKLKQIWNHKWFKTRLGPFTSLLLHLHQWNAAEAEEE